MPPSLCWRRSSRARVAAGDRQFREQGADPAEAPITLSSRSPSTTRKKVRPWSNAVGYFSTTAALLCCADFGETLIGMDLRRSVVTWWKNTGRSAPVTSPASVPLVNRGGRAALRIPRTGSGRSASHRHFNERCAVPSHPPERPAVTRGGRRRSPTRWIRVEGPKAPDLARPRPCGKPSNPISQGCHSSREDTGVARRANAGGSKVGPPH